MRGAILRDRLGILMWTASAITVEAGWSLDDPFSRLYPFSGLRTLKPGLAIIEA